MPKQPNRVQRTLLRGGRPWLAACCLAAIAVTPARAAFPGSNGKIAFTRVTPTHGGEPYRLEIFTVFPEGPRGPHGEYRLVATPPFAAGVPHAALSPAYSPNGTKLAYAALGPGHPGGLEVYLMTSLGEERTRVTSTPPEAGAMGGAREPAWSPDGTMLAYVTGPLVGADEHRNLCLLTSSSQGPILAGIGPDRIAWSPDGTRIVYESAGVLWAYHVEDHRIDPLLPAEALDATLCRHRPAWSPAGDRLAFCQRASAGGPCALWWVRADGTGLEQLTHNAWSDEGPEYSPDGRWLAFFSNRSGHYELYRRRAIPDTLPGPLGAQEVRLTHSPAGGQSLNPSWRPLVEGASIPAGQAWGKRRAPSQAEDEAGRVRAKR
jgi:hypothetical protein